MSETQVLCRLDEIADGGSKGLWEDSRGRALVFAVRRGHEVFAYHNTCPHYGNTRLGWRKDEFLNGAGDQIICSAHGALFGIEDGVCAVGPCLGQSLSKLETWLQDGNVVARLDALPTRNHETRRTA